MEHKTGHRTDFDNIEELPKNRSDTNQEELDAHREVECYLSNTISIL